MSMGARIRVDRLCLDVPAFLQREREPTGWAGLLFGAAFDPPRRQLLRLLDDLSFEVREGDRLAILGRNGAGKSTLLRVLNGVYQPTRGRLEVEGSCQALLNISLGFNGEATVRENIYLRGIAMGLAGKFLRGQISQILEFSGLEEKASHRLRTLSSGQKMRLGFAISTSVQQDIMLMDEWVGAGDADFMRKARERMQDRVGGSKIVVLASHSTGLLRDICNRGIVLERGKLVHAGDITDALKYYHDLLARLRDGKEINLDVPASSGAQIFGAVEEIVVESDACIIRGWFVDTEGVVPNELVLHVNGGRHVAQAIERMRRPDVMRHFGLASDDCGFRAVVPIPGIERLSDLAHDLQVLGGAAQGYSFAPLRISNAVIDSIRSDGSST